jgi:hypothetical protein
MALYGVYTLAAKSPKIFQSSNMTEKRTLLGLVFSNLCLEGLHLRYTLRKLFDLSAGSLNRQEWCATVNESGCWEMTFLATPARPPESTTGTLVQKIPR